MLATPGLSWLWVLASVCLVCAAHHLRVVAAQLVVEALQLIVEVFVGDVTQSQRFALFFEFIVGQRAEAPKCAFNTVKNAHAQMLSQPGLPTHGRGATPLARRGNTNDTTMITATPGRSALLQPC
jgi:hypothetical protein